MKKKIGIIGGGNMGAAIAVAIKKDFSLSVCEEDRARALELKKKFGLRVVPLSTLLTSCDVIILAVKPQSFEEVLSTIKNSNISKKLFISIAAGITTGYIQKRLGKNARVVRTMPNLPARVKASMTALCASRSATPSDIALAKKIFDFVGETIVVQERFVDAVTAISGSGPAYVFLFMEILQKCAQSFGFEKKVSEKLVYQTLLGSLKLYAAEGVDAGILRERVTSKGGTTEAALNVLKNKNFDKIFIEALIKAKQRAKELSR